MAEDRLTRATPAVEWRMAQLVRFPSGNVARLRQVSIINMIAFGRIPNALLETAKEFAGPGVDINERVNDPEQFAEFVRFTHFVAEQAFVEPRLVIDPQQEPQEGEISILDLSDGDLMFVVNWTQGRARSLEPFRAEREGVGGGRDGEEVWGEAQPTGGAE